MRTLTLIATLGIMMTAAGAQAQQQVENAPDPYVHAATGFRFPKTIGPFTRTKVIEYDAAASDTSAGYELLEGGSSRALVTVYVYPLARSPDRSAPAKCKSAYDEARNAITDRFAGTRQTVENERPVPDSDVAAKGRHVAYAMKSDLFSTGGEITSDLYHYCPGGGAWQVKYRVSQPADSPRASEVAELLAALDWPVSLGGKQDDSGGW